MGERVWECGPIHGKLILYRFKTKSVDDYRPLVDMKGIGMPWWCTGEAVDQSYAVIVCYLPVGENLNKYWDDAFEIHCRPCNEIVYSDRFPKPDWLCLPEKGGAE